MGGAVSAGPSSPTTEANDSSVGTVDWTVTGNAGSSNNTYDLFTTFGPTQSHYLKTTGYGFSIPTGATINGITVSVERNSGGAGSGDPGGIIHDTQAQIIKSGTIGSTNKAIAGDWPVSTDAVATYGSTNDLWGETWTPADINNSNFGFALAVEKQVFSSHPSNAFVDLIQITVTYTPAYSGPLYPSTVVSDASFGTTPWSTPESASANDDVRTFASPINPNQATQYLKATNFGFSIPTGATINGIVAEVEGQEGSRPITEEAVRIVKNGSISSTNNVPVPSNDWSTVVDTNYTYGSSSDLWGETWSASDINSSDFGFVISVKNDNGAASGPANIDYMRMTVYYTDTSGATYSTSGTDIIQYDSGASGTSWSALSWTATTPTNTLIKARIRAASTQGDLSSSTYSSYVTTSGGSVSGVTGQWAEVEWRLETTDTAVTPTLNDGTATYDAPSLAITAPTSSSCFLVGTGSTIAGCSTTTTGSTTNITWTSTGASGGDHIRIKYASDGTTFNDITGATALTKTDTSYTWTLPTTTKTTTAKVKVILEDASNVEITSNTSSAFTIHSNSTPAVSPTLPADGSTI